MRACNFTCGETESPHAEMTDPGLAGASGPIWDLRGYLLVPRHLPKNLYHLHPCHSIAWDGYTMKMGRPIFKVGPPLAIAKVGVEYDGPLSLLKP